MLRQRGSFAPELSLASLQVTLWFKTIAASCLLLCLLSSFTHAATQIIFDEGYEIRFDSGRFDTETFNMQITNFEVFKNDKRYWNADAVTLETVLLADGRTLIVKNLQIDSFVSSLDNVKVGTIVVRNITLDKYDHLLAGEIGSLLDHSLNNAYLGMFDFWAPIKGGAEYAAFVQSIEITPVRLTTMPSGRNYFSRIGMRGVTSIKHGRLYDQNKVLGTDNITAYELVKQLSLQNFEIAFDIENVLIEVGGVMRSKLSGHVDVKNHFRTDIDFDAEIPLTTFWEMMNDKAMKNVFTGEFGDEFALGFLASLLQSDAALSKVSLSVRDYGIFERLFDLYAKHSRQSITAATQDIRLKIDQGIKEIFPNEGKRLFLAIDKFLDYGGQIRLSAAPDAPVPFLLFASYMLMPERAMQKLRVTLEQSN